VRKTPLAEVFHSSPRQRRQKISAKLTWEYVVDVEAYSSLIPGNGARKLAIGA
jgi:hypothetical protein